MFFTLNDRLSVIEDPSLLWYLCEVRFRLSLFFIFIFVRFQCHCTLEQHRQPLINLQSRVLPKPAPGTQGSRRCSCIYLHITKYSRLSRVRRHFFHIDIRSNEHSAELKKIRICAHSWIKSLRVASIKYFIFAQISGSHHTMSMDVHGYTIRTPSSANNVVFVFAMAAKDPFCECQHSEFR